MGKKIPGSARLLAFTLVALLTLGCAARMWSGSPEERSRPLTIIAVGDAGETGSTLRGTGKYVTDMYFGIHDAGTFDALLFLGDNFYPTGLNMSASDVQGTIRSVLGPFSKTMQGLGQGNVHAVAGNHDWYERLAIDKSVLFGLISITDGPIGLTDRGNRRAAALESWNYYYEMPANVFYPLSPESSDSVQILFFDSSLPLRTHPGTWGKALDSLGALLSATAGRPGIAWRILALHHPLYTVGEHGGYSVWDDEAMTVRYRTLCDKDSNALGWIKNWLDPEDLCAEKYRQLLDSLKWVMAKSGARVQVSLAGHDHSLQLLSYPDRDAHCSSCPRVHIVSGAASKPARVKFPRPPEEYTSAQTSPDQEGKSFGGFAQLRFEGERLRVVFFNSRNGDRIDMGGGKKEFWIDKEGRLEQ